MGSVITAFEIPDPTRPIPIEERRLGPSGELVPFVPPPVDKSQIVGRVVREVSLTVGTYGMGGPGFFGLRLDSEWLVISLWGAGEWILVDDRLVADAFFAKYGRERPWTGENEDDLEALGPRIVGSTIVFLDVSRTKLEIRFSSGARLVIDETPTRRPILEGSKEPRVLTPEEDLRLAVFLSPTTELWV